MKDNVKIEICLEDVENYVQTCLKEGQLRLSGHLSQPGVIRQ